MNELGKSISEFVTNYTKIVAKVKYELNKTNDDQEKFKLNFYLDSLNTLLEDMYKYTKYKFITGTINHEEMYENELNYKNNVESNNRQRRITHENLLVDIRICDKICRDFGFQELFGLLGKFQNDISPLQQKSIERVVPLSDEAAETRENVAMWAEKIIEKLILKNARMDEREKYEFLSEAFKCLTEEEITGNLRK